MLFQFTNLNMVAYKSEKGPQTVPPLNYVSKNPPDRLRWRLKAKASFCQGLWEEATWQEAPYQPFTDIVEKNSNGGTIRRAQSGDGAPGSLCSVGGLQEIQKFLYASIWGGLAPKPGKEN